MAGVTEYSLTMEKGRRERWEEDGRGLHSSTFRLNVSTFCGIRWVHVFPPVY